MTEGVLPLELMLEVADYSRPTEIGTLRRACKRYDRLLTDRMRVARIEWPIPHVDRCTYLKWPTKHWWQIPVVALCTRHLHPHGVYYDLAFESGTVVRYRPAETFSWQEAKPAWVLPIHWQTLACGTSVIGTFALLVTLARRQKSKYTIACVEHQAVVDAIDPAVIRAWENRCTYSTLLHGHCKTFDDINHRWELRVIYFNDKPHFYNVRVPHPVMDFEDYWASIQSSAELTQACEAAGWELLDAKRHLREWAIPAPGPSPIPPGPSFFLMVALPSLAIATLLIPGPLFYTALWKGVRKEEWRILSS